MKIRQRGQTLIEVLVALAVIVLIVTSITVAVITSLNNAEFVKNQNLATQYAQQGMEIMRFMRNTNYGTFTQLTGTYCLADTCTQLVNTPGTSCSPKTGLTCSANVGTIFVREVTADNSTYVGPTPGATNLCQFGTSVTSTVYWADNKCTDSNNPYCHKVQLFSCFSKGDIVPTLN